jgi:histidine triad (HIT) family protein
MTDSQNNCIYCKIVSGQLPSYKVYEDPKYLAFLDIAPISKGHTLVIPKTHYRWVYDVPDVGEYFEVATKVLLLIKNNLKAEFIHYLTWGLDVPHAHIHIIPKLPGEKLHHTYEGSPKIKVSDSQMSQISQSLLSASKNLS